MTTATEPETAKVRDRDIYSHFVHATQTVPADWMIVAWNADAPEDFIKLRGAVYPVLRSGKRKGRPNYRQPIEGTEREFWVRGADVQAWREKRERETGECLECFGTGDEWAGWSAGEGNRYRTCRRCGGSGKAADVKSLPCRGGV